MNQNTKDSLAPPDAENKDSSKRKMTAAIIEDQEKQLRMIIAEQR